MVVLFLLGNRIIEAVFVERPPHPAHVDVCLNRHDSPLPLPLSLLHFCIPFTLTLLFADAFFVRFFLFLGLAAQHSLYNDLHTLRQKQTWRRCGSGCAASHCSRE